MGVSIGPKIGVQGADQFRYEFKEMATVARQLKAEMDALTSSFKENDTETNKNGKTREALTKRIEQQEKVIEKAKQGVELATKAQENAVAANERAKAKLDDLIKKREDAKKSLETATAAQEKAQERVNSLNEASERLTEKLAQLKLEGKENTDAFKDLEHSVKYVDKEFDKAAKTLIDANKAQADAESQVKKLNTAVKSQEDKVEATERSITKANITVSEYQTKVAEATKEQNDLNAALEKTPESLESFGEDLIKKGEAISQVGEAISKVLAPFSALTVFSLKGASSFTDALAKISTIADTSIVSLEEFGDGIKQIASDTGFATDDIAAATYQALSAAVSTEEALKFTAGAADLARAGFLDMFGSVDVLTTILNAYHKSVDDVGHISDVLVKVQDKGKTTVKELAQNMGNVIPMAAQYGIKLEDLGAAYVVLTKQGINTAKTTTYLRSAFTELEKEGSDASKALKNETGKTFVQLLANGKSLGEIMKILKDSVNGDEEAFIHLFGNIRTASGAMALANTSAAEYAETLYEVGNSNGQAARNVEKLQTPSLKLKKIWEQLRTSGIDLGEQLIDTLLPALDKLAKWVRTFTDKFKSLHKSTKQMIAIMAGILGVIGPMVTGVGKLIIGFGRFAKAMSILFKVSAPMVATFGALAAGAIALGSLFGVMVIKSNEAAEAYKDMVKEQWGINEAMEENIKQSNDLIETNKSYRESTLEKAKATQAETELASGLLAQLRKLYDKNGEITEGNITNAEIIKGQLAEALGVEVEWIDELIKKNGIYSKTIDNLIEQRKKEAEQEVFLEAYKEQYRTMIDLERERNDVGNDLIAQNDKYLKAHQERVDAQKVLEEAERRGLTATEEQTQAWSKAVDAEDEAWKALETVSKQYTATGESIDGAREDLEFYVQKLMETSGMSKEEATEAAKTMIGSMSEVKQENKDAIAEIQANTDKGMADFNQSIDSNSAETADAAGRVADSALKPIRKAAEETPNIGKHFAQGFINGIMGKVGEAGIAGTLLGNTAANKTKEAGKTNSPSKVMAEIGGYYGEGFVNGLAGWLSSASAMGSMLGSAAFPDTSWTSNYSRLPDYAYGTTNNTRNISAPIAVNVNVNGNVDDPNGLADIIEQRLVEKIINNERAFA